VGGAPLSLDAWALAATLFLWTPPHFWALALARIADYQDARVPTLPSVAGFERTARVVLVHAVATVAVASVPWLTGRLGLIALSGSLLSGAVWLWLLRRAHCEPTAQRWWAAYKMSGVYLLATLVSMLVDIGRG
jgi:protoheme IX farnesyltransferase